MHCPRGEVDTEWKAEGYYELSYSICEKTVAPCWHYLKSRPLDTALRLSRRTMRPTAARALLSPHMRVQTSRFMCSAATTVATALTAVIKPLGAGYAITCAIALLAQRKLQYFPSAVRPSHPGAVNTLFADIQEVEFVSADGTRCLGWHWPAPTAAEPVLPWWLPKGGALPRLAGVVAELRRERLQQMDLVLFHGNAGDRSHRLGWMHLVRECLGCSVTVRRMRTLHAHMRTRTARTARIARALRMHGTGARLSRLRRQ